MARNDDVQDERYVVVPWMARNDDVQDERLALKFPAKAKYLHPCKQYRGAMAILRHPCLHGISASMHVDGKERRYFIPTPLQSADKTS